MDKYLGVEVIYWHRFCIPYRIRHTSKPECIIQFTDDVDDLSRVITSIQHLPYRVEGLEANLISDGNLFTLYYCINFLFYIVT